MKARVFVRHEREGSYAELGVNRGLKSGKINTVVLDEQELLELAKDALDAALILGRKHARR